MSTSEIYLTDEEIADFIRETKISPQGTYGDEGAEYGVCPFISFYVYHHDEDFLPIAAKMIQIYEKLKGFIDFPFQMELKNATETWFKVGDKRLPTDLYAEAEKAFDKGPVYWLQATDMESPAASALWAINASVYVNSSMRYSTLKITYHYQWYLQNKAQWHSFVEDCLRALEPEQCYSSFEIGTTTGGYGGAYESDVMERICADYFYGLDVDHPSNMGFQYHRDEDGWVNQSDFSAGIRTPTWCFLLSPIWLTKLGMDEAGVRQALNDPRIKISSLPRTDGGVNLWIQLGELSLYPVEEGVPPLPVLASKLIKPIRCDKLELTSLAPWDDDPNPRFDMLTSVQWMQRFDENSLWPTAAIRQTPTAPHSPPVPPKHRVEGNHPCPADGYYITPAKVQSRTYFKRGDLMPEYGNEIWQTIWQWDINQEN